MAIDWDTYHTEGTTEQYLFRYMSLERAKEMLSNRAIYFARMDEFDDKLEGISVYDITELVVFYNIVQPDMNWNPSLGKEGIENEIKKAKRSLSEVHKRVIRTQESHWVSCWYNSNRESIAMWNLYSKNKGVAIRFDRNLLQDHMRDNRKNQALHDEIVLLIGGRVEYQDYTALFQNEKRHLLKYLAYRKDESFSHEKEYRFVLTSKNPISEKIKGINFQISVPLQSLGLKVIAHPDIRYPEFENMKRELLTIDPDLKFERSELEKWFQFKEKITSILTEK